MFNEPDNAPDLLRKYDQSDLIASVVRTSLSVALPFGGIIGEFVTHLVPRQRLSRAVEFIERMNERLATLEGEFKARLANSPGYFALTEEVVLAAVQAASTERRRDLVELLKTGLGRPDAELLEHQALLRLVVRLNDAQVLILMNYGSFAQTMGNAEREAFRKKHSAVFGARPPDSASSDDERRKWTMYRLFEDELVTLGLLRDTEGVIRSSPRRAVAITHLGRLLLDAIGRTTDSSGAR
jgi:hypothetical protein